MAPHPQGSRGYGGLCAPRAGRVHGRAGNIASAIAIAALCGSSTSLAAGSESGGGPTNAQALAPVVAAAPPAAPSPEARKAAGAAFAAGEKAYSEGKYAEAASAFEDAYTFVPHPDVLLNAASAWQKANDPARAANILEKYLRTAPADAADRKSAKADLDKLATKLGRYTIYAPGADAIEVDERPVPTTGATTGVYVSPGTHVIRGRFGDKTLQQTQGVEAGGVTSVALSPDNATEPKGNPKGGPTGPEGTHGQAGREGAPPPAKDDAFKPFPPLAVYIGAGATALLAGSVIASGVDTLNAKSDFDANPTNEALTDGRVKQTRTNVLVGMTVAAAAITGVAAVFFVRWSSPKPDAKASVDVGVSLGSIVARGAF